VFHHEPSLNLLLLLLSSLTGIIISLMWYADVRPVFSSLSFLQILGLWLRLSLFNNKTDIVPWLIGFIHNVNLLFVFIGNRLFSLLLRLILIWCLLLWLKRIWFDLLLWLILVWLLCCGWSSDIIIGDFFIKLISRNLPVNLLANKSLLFLLLLLFLDKVLWLWCFIGLQWS
jgi:hypothetical protein